jgi:hypothetical protein
MAQEMHAAPASGHGWALFAGVMFLVVAAANTIYGIAALADDKNFAGDALFAGDLTAWGILSLLFAVAQAGAGILILRQRALGAVFGITLATFHAISALGSLPAYPLWTLIVLVLDGLIIYGLCVHGDRWTT